MLDKTLVNIISMTIGAVGLIGAITKYGFPKANRTVYGENLFRLRQDIINNYVIWCFTIYAAIGLLFQLVFNEILGDEIPERLYSKGFYFLALTVSVVLIASLIPFIKTLSRRASRGRWQREIAKKAESNYLLALKITTENQRDSDNKRVAEIVNWLEELFESKSHKQDLKSRLEFLGRYFN